MAPPTASAHSVRIITDVKLRGANKPKLAKSKVSQKTRRATNAFGVPCPTCCANSQPVSPILAASVIACPSHHRSRGSAGFKASSESSSCCSSSYVDELPRSTSARCSGNKSALLRSAYRRSVSRAGSVCDPYRRNMRSSRRISADSAVTSPPRAMNKLFAFEINSPSTSAEIVATTHRHRDEVFGFVGHVMRWQALSCGPAGKCPCQDYREDDKPDE
jgi:hypothetical protein